MATEPFSSRSIPSGSEPVRGSVPKSAAAGTVSLPGGGFALRVSYANTGSTGFIQRVFDVMVESPQCAYQLLARRLIRLSRMTDRLPWPSNVWVGVSIEHRAEALRADRLREVPAAVRFISAGPLEVEMGGIDQGDHRGLPVLIHNEVALPWPGDRVGGVGQADRKSAVSSSELSTSSP